MMKQTLTAGLPGLNLELPEDRIDTLVAFGRAMVKQNEVMNLTGITDDKGGIASYGQVCDLLVNWHIQTVVLPSIKVEDSYFDPYDSTQVDLSGNVNYREPTEPAETTEGE